MDRICYNSGYKYQLKETYTLKTSILPSADIVTPYVTLDAQGTLTIQKGYAWDGPSGPTIDTKTFMRGALVHDALYQLIRDCNGQFPEDPHRLQADELLRAICLADGMNSIRAWWVFKAVRLFGQPSADPANKRPVEWAPG
jgi:hypothetical protein